MKKILSFIKSKLPNQQMLAKFLSAFLVVIFFTSYTGMAINNQEPLLPKNPLNDTISENSDVHLMQNSKDFAHAEERSDDDLDNEEDTEEENDDQESPEKKDSETKETKERKEENDNENEIEQTEDNNEEENGEVKEEATEENSEQKSHNQQEKSNEKEENQDKQQESTKEGNQPAKDKDPNHKEGEGFEEGDDVPDQDNKEIVDDEPKDDLEVNEYFTASIEDEETVTEENYSFIIKQLDHDHAVKDVHVDLDSNDGRVDNISTDYNNPVRTDLRLAEGKNTIRIGVTYEVDEETFTVHKTYTVHFINDEIIIESNLENQQLVFDKNFNFQAHAKMGDENTPLTVKLNSDVIKEKGKSNYEVILAEGENEIVLESEHKGKHVKKEYTIEYQKPELKIDTNLKNETVDDADLSFHAKAFDKDQQIDLSLTHNNHLIKENKKGQYSVKLTEGENEFHLAAEKGDAAHEETYIVIYNPHADEGEEEEDNEHAPSIEIFDIEDGQTIKSSSYTFHVKSNTYDGESITDGNGNITAKNNGERIDVNWVDSDQISFTMDVQDGDNKIEITSTDSEGNSATKKLTVRGDPAEEGEVIGTITISVEATTIGLGNIIGPESMEIRQGDNGVSVIDRIFKEHGIDYDHTGQPNNSFYLEAIRQPGLVTDPKIPSDLAEILEEGNGRFEPDDYSSDMLGEFDFAEGSGWMYSVNGNYPNVGFADWTFKDGDEVRIRFTLALGSDIGGGAPGTNLGKEW